MRPFHKKRGVPDGNPINAGALAVGDWVGGGWRKVIFRGDGSELTRGEVCCICVSGVRLLHPVELFVI